MRRAGFTLAELLVALTLTALAVGVVTEGVRRSLAFEARLAEARQERERTTAALAALRSRLETIVPATAPGADGQGAGASRRTPSPMTPPDETASGNTAGANPARDANVLFDGTADSAIFLAADPGYPARPGLYEYRLSVTVAGDEDEAAAPSNTLVLSRRALSDLSGFAGPGETQSWPILTSPETITLSYADQPGRWRSDWRERDALPAQLRIEFGGEPAPPAFVVNLPRMPPEAEETIDETGAEAAE